MTRFHISVPVALVIGASIASCAGMGLRATSEANAPAGRYAQPGNVVMSSDGRQLAYVEGDSLFVADIERGTRRGLIDGVAGEASTPIAFLAFSPDGAQLIARQGYIGSAPGVPVIIDVATGLVTQVLPDSLRGRLATFQNLWAGGPSWSPDSRQVAFLALDSRDPAHVLQVHVVDRHGTNLRRLTDGSLGRFAVAWSPNGRWLAYASGRLDQRVSTVNLVNAADVTGAHVVAYRDSTGALHNLSWSPDGRVLLAQDRSWRAVLLNVDTAGRATAVPHKLPRRKFTGWLPSTEAFLTSVGSGMSRRLALVRRDGTTTLMTGPDTTAAPVGVAAHRGAARLAYTMTAGNLPLDVWVGDVDSSLRVEGQRRATRSAEGISGPLPQSRVYRWTSGEGDTLQALLLIPPTARAPYPLIIAPYGGYANQFPKLNYFFEAGFLPLLQDGYVIALPNTRGIATDERDLGRYGEPQLEDTRLLVQALTRDRLIRPRSVAVMGHSHGGAMAYYYLTHADLWCGVVAVNGRADWMLQARHPGDTYLAYLIGGSPDSLPARYAALSPASNARRASAPVLAVAGMRDTQILPQNVTIMRDSMLVAGKQIDTLTFADEGHLIMSEANQVTLWRRVRLFLRQHCSG